MDYPILDPTPNSTFKLYEDYTIANITIPKGFVTDGLTLKNRLFRVIVDKYQPKFAPFFVIHDYLCSLNKYKEADTVGSKILFRIEYSFRTKTMIKAIKLYHRLKYGVK